MLAVPLQSLVGGHPQRSPTIGPGEESQEGGLPCASQTHPGKSSLREFCQERDFFSHPDLCCRRFKVHVANLQVVQELLRPKLFHHVPSLSHEPILAQVSLCHDDTRPSSVQDLPWLEEASQPNLKIRLHCGWRKLIDSAVVTQCLIDVSSHWRISGLRDPGHQHQLAINDAQASPGDAFHCELERVTPCQCFQHEFPRSLSGVPYQ